MSLVELVSDSGNVKLKDSNFKPQPRSALPFDPRFPNTNQTKNCYQNYLDFFRCQKVKGEDYEPCNWYKHAYKELCPPFWVEKWDEQRENGTFPGRI